MDILDLSFMPFCFLTYRTLSHRTDWCSSQNELGAIADTDIIKSRHNHNDNNKHGWKYNMLKI